MKEPICKKELQVVWCTVSRRRFPLKNKKEEDLLVILLCNNDFLS